jgi:hypothetical protein
MIPLSRQLWLPPNLTHVFLCPRAIPPMTGRVLIGGLLAAISCVWLVSLSSTSPDPVATTATNGREPLDGSYQQVASPCVVAPQPLGDSAPSTLHHAASSFASSVMDVECVVHDGLLSALWSRQDSGSAAFTASLLSAPSFVRVVVSNCSSTNDEDVKPAMRAWVRREMCLLLRLVVRTHLV